MKKDHPEEIVEKVKRKKEQKAVMGEDTQAVKEKKKTKNKKRKNTSSLDEEEQWSQTEEVIEKKTKMKKLKNTSSFDEEEQKKNVEVTQLENMVQSSDSAKKLETDSDDPSSFGSTRDGELGWPINKKQKPLKEDSSFGEKEQKKNVEVTQQENMVQSSDSAKKLETDSDDPSSFGSTRDGELGWPINKKQKPLKEDSSFGGKEQKKNVEVTEQENMVQSIDSAKKLETDSDDPLSVGSTRDEEPQTPVSPQATGSKTVYMANLNESIQEKDVRIFFGKAGEVLCVNFLMKNRKFTRTAFVEFDTPEGALNALKLNYTELMGQSVTVEFPKKKEKGASGPGKRARSSSANRSCGDEELPKKTLFMGDLSSSIKEEDVKKFFEDAGVVARVKLHYDRKDIFKGSAFVDFETPEGAQKALKLNNTKLMGQPVKVQFPKEKGASGPGKRARSSSANRSCGDEKLPKKRPKKADVIMVEAPSAIETPQTPGTQATGSKTLFMGDLSSSIQDVKKLLEDAGTGERACPSSTNRSEPSKPRITTMATGVKTVFPD